MTVTDFSFGHAETRIPAQQISPADASLIDEELTVFAPKRHSESDAWRAEYDARHVGYTPSESQAAQSVAPIPQLPWAGPQNEAFMKMVRRSLGVGNGQF